MQISDAVRVLNSRLAELSWRIAGGPGSRETVICEQGATIALLDDAYGQSHAVSARLIGMSAAAASDLVSRAQAAGTQVRDPMDRALRLSPREAISYLHDNHEEIDQVVASFSDSDVLYLTGLHPRVWAEATSNHLWVPHMALHLASSDQWIGITDVNVGYSGSGRHAARTLLSQVLHDQNLAERIASHRVSVVDINDQSRGIFQNEWPLYPLSRLEFHGSHLSTTFSLERPSPWALNQQRQKYDHDGSGFYPTEPALPPLQHWLALLDSPDRPEWLSGRRRGRLYLSPQAALRDGFGGPAGRSSSSIQRMMSGDIGGGNDRIIIEQGDLQLRLRAHQPRDSTMYLSDVMSEALEALRLSSHWTSSRDGQSRWIRAIRRQLGGRSPQHVPLGDDIAHVLENE